MARRSTARVTPSMVQDDVQIGGFPGAPNIGTAPRPVTQRTLSSDPTKEYLAGVSLGATWYLNLARSLGPYIDDLSEHVGVDIYERMATDPQVLASINVFKAAVLETGPEFAAALDDEDDPDFAKAQFLADWCTDIFEDLTTPIMDVLWNMGDAFHLGNKVAELLYDYSDQYTDLPAPKPKKRYGPNGEELPPKPIAVYKPASTGPQLVLTGIKVKPRENVGFLTDTFMNTIGILGLIPGQSYPIMPGMVYADISTIPNLLPLDKFAVLTFRPVNNDPRGTSLLRSAYRAWFIKEQLWGEYGKFLSQMAGGFLVGKPDPNAMPESIQDANGQPTGSVATPEEALLQTLLKGRNGAVLVVQPGADVKVEYPTADGSAFLQAFELLNLEITKGTLHVTLATEEGKHQSRSAAEVHVDVLQLLIRTAKQAVERWVRSILQRMVSYNYGDDARRLVPTVSLGETDSADQSKLWTAIAALMTASYFTPDQLPQMDVVAGIPVRMPPDPEQLAQQAQQQAQANQPPAVSGQQPPPGVDPMHPEDTPEQKPATPPPKQEKFAKGRTVTVSAKPKPADLKRVEAAYKEWASESQADLLKSVE